MMKEQAFQAVAADLLVLLGTNLTERSRKELELLVTLTEEHRDWFSVTVSRPGKDSSLSRDGELVYRFHPITGAQADEMGDVYRTYKLIFSVNWSGCNEKVDGETLARLHVMMQLAQAAAVLAQKYSETFKVLVRTAAQEEERKVAAKKVELNRKVETLAEHAVKGLRVNSNCREVSRTIFANIPDGTYEVSYTNNYDTKTYGVRLTQYGAFLTRKA